MLIRKENNIKKGDDRMIFEVNEDVWRAMTDIAKDSLLKKKGIIVQLYREVVNKKGITKVPTMTIEGGA